MALKFKTRLEHKAVIDITSLIDLVFLLVAFFMVTSSMGSESSITVHLPRAVQAGDYKKGNVTISIKENNGIFINDEAVAKDNLLDEIKSRKEQMDSGTVVIRGDRMASYETVVFIMDTLNRAGVPKFTIATEN